MDINPNFKRNKAIIGIQIGITSGCAIYRNGEIVFASSEERYSRKKNDTASSIYNYTIVLSRDNTINIYDFILNCIGFFNNRINWRVVKLIFNNPNTL